MYNELKYREHLLFDLCKLGKYPLPVCTSHLSLKASIRQIIDALLQESKSFGNAQHQISSNSESEWHLREPQISTHILANL